VLFENFVICTYIVCTNIVHTLTFGVEPMYVGCVTCQI
jgi:hypothetical protein